MHVHMRPTCPPPAACDYRRQSTGTPMSAHSQKEAFLPCQRVPLGAVDCVRTQLRSGLFAMQRREVLRSHASFVTTL
jgi:hypothetical protein